MDRYKFYRDENRVVRWQPYFSIPVKPTDRYITYKPSVSRLDNISYKYYKNPNYGYIIMMANVDKFSNETDLVVDTEIRIPYPIEDILTYLNNKNNNYTQNE